MQSDVFELDPFKEFDRAAESRRPRRWALCLTCVVCAGALGSFIWWREGARQQNVVPSGRKPRLEELLARSSQAAPVNTQARALNAEAKLAKPGVTQALGPSKTTETALHSAEVGKFYVQVAAFRPKELADEWARELTSSGTPAHSTVYDGGQSGIWNVVRLGPFATRVNAEQARLRLPPAKRADSYVLPRSNGLFHVQVASLDSEETAREVAGSFERRGHHVKVSVVTAGGRTWHCVRIGPFDSRQEAVAYQDLLTQSGHSGGSVIPFERTN